MQNLTLLELASAMARHSGLRHSVIAENVANADTPGYRARDVQSFSELVNDGFTMRQTRGGHLSAGAGPLGARIVEDGARPAPNGNSVNLEDQTMRAVAAQSDHTLAMRVYSKAIDILRIGLGPNR